MSVTSEILSRYNEIRQNLRHPKNAVPDRGIDLRRHRLPQEPVDNSKPKVIDSSNGIAACRVMVAEIQGVCVDRKVSLDVLERLVASHFKLNHRRLYIRRRSRDVVYPRQILWYLAVQHTTLSLPQIGRRGDYDHTTIMHARDKIAELILVDEYTAGIVKNLETLLFGPNGPDQAEATMATVNQPDMAEQREQMEREWEASFSGS